MTSTPKSELLATLGRNLIPRYERELRTAEEALRTALEAGEDIMPFVRKVEELIGRIQLWEKVEREANPSVRPRHSFR